MDFSKGPFSRSDREPSEPTCHELRLASAISANSPYRVFQALNSLAIALSGEPFGSGRADCIRSALYPFLSDTAAGRDRVLPVFLPADKGFLKVKLSSASDTPTVSLELGPSTSFWAFFLGRTLITGLPVPLIFVAPPQYSFTPAPGGASDAPSSLADSLPVHSTPAAAFTDPEWDAALAAGPTLLEQLAAIAIYTGSAHGLLAVLRHIALAVTPGYSSADTSDADLEHLTSRLQAVHHALSTRTNANVRIDLPGGGGDLDLCCLTVGDVPHVRVSIRTLPYPNTVGYSWGDILSELPVPLPSLPDGSLTPIPSELHERAVKFTGAERMPLSIDHLMQLIALSGDESLIRLAIDDIVAYRRHNSHATDTELIQSLFVTIVLLCQSRPMPLMPLTWFAPSPVLADTGHTDHGQTAHPRTLVSPGVFASVGARLHSLRKHTPFR